ncbi:hypothetical protein D5086_009705 [Populus alba]|uniref:Uncharacterized protein n=1 Tax=Populus alba TaxID=43335 RepID=A0ACC4C7Z9_POPAL
MKIKEEEEKKLQLLDMANSVEVTRFKETKFSCLYLLWNLEAWRTSLPLSLRRLQQVSKLVYLKDLREEWKAKA